MESEVRMAKEPGMEQGMGMIEVDGAVATWSALDYSLLECTNQFMQLIGRPSLPRGSLTLNAAQLFSPRYLQDDLAYKQAVISGKEEMRARQTAFLMPDGKEKLVTYVLHPLKPEPTAPPSSQLVFMQILQAQPQVLQRAGTTGAAEGAGPTLAGISAAPGPTIKSLISEQSVPVSTPVAFSPLRLPPSLMSVDKTGTNPTDSSSLSSSSSMPPTHSAASTQSTPQQKP
jgi:hypothetical protein